MHEVNTGYWTQQVAMYGAGLIAYVFTPEQDALNVSAANYNYYFTDALSRLGVSQ